MSGATDTPDLNRRPGPAIFAPGSKALYVFAAIAAVSALAFLGLGAHIAIFGTGAALPSGEHVVEGVLSEGRLAESPAGEPFLFGEVTLGSPGGSGIVDHRWRGPAGDPEVRVDTENGPRTVRLPAATLWRGRPTTDERVVQNLGDLPVVSTSDQTEAHVSPPYAIAVRAVRPGDHLIAQVSATSPEEGAPEAIEVYVGERAVLQQDIDEREATRWPIIFMLVLVGTAGSVLARRTWRRAKAA